MTRMTIISFLVLTHLLQGCPQWLADPATPYLWRMLLYPFYHTGIWHLAVNCLAVWTVFTPRRRNIRNLFTAYVISAVVYPLSVVPAVGISNVIYAVIGLRSPALSSRWWRSSPVIIFLAVTFGMLFIPGISGVTHIAAMALGMMAAAFHRFNEKLDSDAERCRHR